MFRWVVRQNSSTRQSCGKAWTAAAAGPPSVVRKNGICRSAEKRHMIWIWVLTWAAGSQGLSEVYRWNSSVEFRRKRNGACGQRSMDFKCVCCLVMDSMVLRFRCFFQGLSKKSGSWMKSKPAKRQKQKRKKKKRKRQKRQDSRTCRDTKRSTTFGHTDILSKGIKGTTPKHPLGFGTATGFQRNELWNAVAKYCLLAISGVLLKAGMDLGIEVAILKKQVQMSWP